MSINEQAQAAKNDPVLREDLIREYRNYIMSESSKTVGRFVTEDSDTASVAMLAFDEAIRKYDGSKGDFLPFAARCIKSRVTDQLRAQYRERKTVPFSALSGTDDNGDEITFDVADTRSEKTDTALEIDALKEELADYDISFFELPRFSPKSAKTKRACAQVISFIMGSPLLVSYIREKRVLPAKRIQESIRIPDKLLERHRKYILTAVIILDGDYENLAGYLSFIKRGAE